MAKGILLRLGAIGLGFVVALAAAEVLVAQFTPQLTWSRLLSRRAKHFALLGVFAPCDYLPFTLRPGAEDVMENVDFRCHWKINRHGMREPERDLAKSSNEFRILALGDSFTAGHGVEEAECWPRVLERLCGHESNVRVINASYTAGYAPDCYYAYLRRHIDELAPDLVLVALFAGNDTVEMLDHFAAEVDAEGLPVRVLSEQLWIDEWGRRRLQGMSRPFAYQFPWLRDRHLWILGCRAFIAPATGYIPRPTPFSRTYDERGERSYQYCVRLLERMRRLVEERGSRFACIVIPDCVQIDGTVEHEDKRFADFDPDYPQARLLPDLETSGISVVDLRPALMSEVQRGDGIWRLYYRLDRHFTAAGQRLAAAAICGWLDDEALLLGRSSALTSVPASAKATRQNKTEIKR